MNFTIEEFLKYSTIDLTTVLDHRDANPNDSANSHINLVVQKIIRLINTNSLYRFNYDNLQEWQKETFKKVCMDYMIIVLQDGHEAQISTAIFDTLASDGFFIRRHRGGYYERFI